METPFTYNLITYIFIINLKIKNQKHSIHQVRFTVRCIYLYKKNQLK